MRGTFISRLRDGASNLIRDQRGNAFMLTAAAIVPILGLVGSGVDIGRAYMAQLRLQQACDAGVLAGRRAMGSATYTAAAKAEADKMFAYNYPSNTYNSSGVSFSSQADGPSNVKGAAAAYIPTTIMKIFFFDGFNLTVNCAAKLEISNVDIMMVLDVTGSMSSTNSGDTANRITGLKNATMDFFDTMTSAEVGDGRLRFGVVPYSSSANVGAILMAKDSSWISNNMLLPSRTPMMRYRWNNSTPPNTVTNGTTTNGAWNDVMPISGFSSTSCSTVTPPGDSSPVSSGSPNPNRTSYYVDQNGNRIYAYDTALSYQYYNYRYSWTGGKCVLQRRTVTYARPSTSVAPVQTFYDQYRYEDRLFDVTQAKTGNPLVTDTGDSGANFSATWGGCVMERRTTPFASNETAPSDAYDMDIDSAPTSDEATKWQILIPEVAFPRAQGPGNKPSTSGVLTVGSGSVTLDSAGSKGNYQRYSKYWADGWGVCPAAAMKLTTMTAADTSTFNTYINSLQPVGGTYHDSGMVWGLRLLSAEGLFASENSVAPNTRPIYRHIIFMTDGDMSANTGNLTFQGYDWISKRVSGGCTDTVANCDTALTARHNNRFLQLCDKARTKNITVWVVSFGTTLNSQLKACATSEANAFEAKNTAALNDSFQSIARQISKLRLSQ